jgi:hypothetical protein
MPMSPRADDGSVMIMARRLDAHASEIPNLYAIVMA